MKTIDQIEQMLNEMGVETIHEQEEDSQSSDFYFVHNDHIMWCFGDEDQNFIEFAILGVFDVTDENRAELLDITNEFNLETKYVKAIVGDEGVHLTIEQYKVTDLRLDHITEYLDYLSIGWHVLGDMILGPGRGQHTI